MPNWRYWIAKQDNGRWLLAFGEKDKESPRISDLSRQQADDVMDLLTFIFHAEEEARVELIKALAPLS